MGYRVPIVLSLLLATSIIAGASVVHESASPVDTAEAHHGPPSWSNATFLPVEPEDRRPGEEAATYNIYGGQGVDYVADFLKVESAGLDWSNCDTSDLRAEGIKWEGQREYDRPPRGDDTTTRSDESIVQYSESPQYREDGIWVDWYEDEDALGDAPRFNATDEIVVQYGDCFQNPDETGWYQMTIFVNGTDKDSGEYVEHEYDSHYFAICEECDNRAEAEEELGPPPGQGDDEPADTTTATPTDEQADDDGGGDDGTGDDGAGDDGTDDGDDGTGDDGAGDDGTDDGGDDGAGEDDGDDGAGDDGTDDGGDDGAGEDDGDDGTGDNTEDDDASADGVGFGAVVAVVALLAAALVIRRTDR